MKKALLALLAAIILISFSGGVYLLERDHPVWKSKSVASAHVATSKPRPPKNRSFGAYDIKGISARLSKKGKLQMARWRSDIVTTANRNPGLVYLNGSAADKLVCLTFDDGPDGTITPKIMASLKQYGVKGNFFFVGSYVKTHAPVVRQAFREGNLILNHSYNHPLLAHSSESFVLKEFQKTNETIAGVIGKEPALIRPPYGTVTANVLQAARDNRQKIILWSTDTLDWSQKDPKNIANNVLSNVRPGEIILMHSNGDKLATLKALPLIIEGLQARGYRITTLDQLLHVRAYK